MNQLWEMEQIKQLKARYFRALDTNDWELFASCLEPECTARYDDGKHAFDSRDEIVAYMSASMSGPGLLSMHNGHHPEIEVAEDGVNATGIWYLQDMIIHLESRSRLYGCAIYRDTYHRRGGEWKISSTAYTRTFECVEKLSEKHRVTNNMFDQST